MEGSHGQLGTRFADRLGSDNTDCLAKVDQVSTGQITAVTQGTNTTLALTGQNRANLDALKAGIFDSGDPILINHVVRFNQHLVSNRIDNFIQGHPTKDTIAKTLDHFAAFSLGGNFDSVKGIAILLSNDGILGDVNQTPGQITGVGRLQRRISQTLTCAVGRDKVLENRQAFSEICGNRGFNNRTVRLSHQTAHPRQLTNLLGTTTRSRISHHVNGIEGWNRNGLSFFRNEFVDGNISKHDAGNILSTLGPDIDYLVVAFAIGNQTFSILLLNVLYLIRSDADPCFFGVGNFHIIKTDGDTGEGGKAEAGLLDLVSEDNCFFGAGKPETDIDQLGNLLLAHDQIDMFKRDNSRNNLVKQNPSNG